MVFDPPENETVLFGAQSWHGSPATNGTWAFRNGVWVNLSTTAGPDAPPGGRSAALAYDPLAGYVVAWGGTLVGSCPAPFPACNATFEFKGNRWSQLPTTHTPPPTLGLPSMAYDAADGYVVLFLGWVGSNTGPQTWTFAAGNWTNVTASVRSSPAQGLGASMAYDPDLREVILNTGTKANSTWAFSGGTWTDLNVTQGPGLQDAPMTYDASQGCILLYGGESDVTGYFSQTTWTFESGNWSFLNIPGAGNNYGGQLSYNPLIPGSLALGSNATTWVWGAGPPGFGVTISATPPSTDPGVPVSFTASIRAGTAPFGYRWNFDDGATNTTASPTHAYSGSGSFNVTLNLTDSKGNSTLASLVVVIYPAPNATFAPSRSTTAVGLPTQFHSVETGGEPPYSFAWEFGDGSSGAGQNPIHNYSSPGTYGVEGWANDSQGRSTSGTFRMTVLPALRVVNISAVPNPVDLASPVNFSASIVGGVGPFTYAWEFGDGGTGGNLSVITHIFTTDGPFVSTVRVGDALGESAIASVNLTIRLNASIFANVSGGFAPLSVTFQGQATGGRPGYSYAWSFGDGQTGESVTASHEFQLPGRYLVHLDVRDSLGRIANATTVISVESAATSGASSLLGDAFPVPWTIVLVGVAMLGGGAIGAAYRRAPREPRGRDPSSPYAPYADAVRSRLPLRPRRPPPSGGGENEPLSDLF
jgi:PKD repeat protein